MYGVEVKLLAEAAVISTQLGAKGLSSLTWSLLGLFLTTWSLLHMLPKRSYMAGGDLRGRESERGQDRS